MTKKTKRMAIDMNKANETVTASMPPQVKAQLIAILAIEGKTISEFVRDAIQASWSVHFGVEMNVKAKPVGRPKKSEG